ncbi:MAG: imidazole glycerol phosphate synthase subunit HisH [Leptospirales bacterium]|nr:imidazole glycerol phosphate synthase subunit HisH [Leptospirales bacterium]
MQSNEVVIIDYGVGNLLSVQRGFEHFGARVTLSSDAEIICRARRLVLPGVGAFGAAMNVLRSLQLFEPILEAARSGAPLLGICLGMQMLFEESEEFGLHKGLALIPGRVAPVPSVTTDGSSQRIPHIGWSALYPATNSPPWRDTSLAEVKPGDSVYFVHSFMAMPVHPSDRLADANYGGHSVAGVVKRNNVTGCQFHPEKSGSVGLSILKNFLQ